jgi:hypothetical protein
MSSGGVLEKGMFEKLKGMASAGWYGIDQPFLDDLCRERILASGEGKDVQVPDVTGVVYGIR